MRSSAKSSLAWRRRGPHWSHWAAWLRYFSESWRRFLLRSPARHRRGGNWAFCPARSGFEQGEPLHRLFVGAHSVWQPAHSLRCVRASSKCSRGVRVVLLAPLAAWRSSSIWSLFRCGSNCFSSLKRLRGKKPSGSRCNLISVPRARAQPCVAQVFGNTDDDAFDTFGGEADSGEICDGARGKTRAVVEPEDLPVAFLIRSSQDRSRWWVISWMSTARSMDLGLPAESSRRGEQNLPQSVPRWPAPRFWV